MSINLTLNCWVLGENPHENTFHVFVNTNEGNTIGLLKELIKEKQPRTFANVDSKDLKLWKVDIPLNNLNTVDTKFGANNKGVKKSSPLDEISEIFANKPPQVLSPLDEISEYFASQPNKKHIHLIIQPKCEFGSNQADSS
ncbi:8319_t:CDS:1, partial [Racocetra persica]